MNTTRATGTGAGIDTGIGIGTGTGNQPCMWGTIGVGMPCTRGTIGIGALIGTGAGLTARWRGCGA